MFFFVVSIQVRVYDIKAQRRPVIDFDLGDQSTVTHNTFFICLPTQPISPFFLWIKTRFFCALERLLKVCCELEGFLSKSPTSGEHRMTCIKFATENHILVSNTLGDVWCVDLRAPAKSMMRYKGPGGSVRFYSELAHCPCRQPSIKLTFTIQAYFSPSE